MPGMMMWQITIALSTSEFANDLIQCDNSIRKNTMINSDLASQHALDHLAHSGFEALTQMDQDLATLWLWDAGVINGGFVDYFASKGGNLAFHAPVALRRIGAVKMADISEAANFVFGPSGPPMEMAERESLLKAFGSKERTLFDSLEAQLFDLEEDLDELLDQYLNNTTHFPEGARPS
jgi:hypothetical protein